MELKAVILIGVAVLYASVACIELSNNRMAWGLVFASYAVAGIATFIANRG